MAKQTLYEFFGVAPEASDAQIAAVLRIHRAVIKSTTDLQERQNQLVFLEHAENTLTNAQKRANYDRQTREDANLAQTLESLAVADEQPQPASSWARNIFIVLLLVGSVWGWVEYQNSHHPTVQASLVQLTSSKTEPRSADKTDLANGSSVKDTIARAPSPIPQAPAVNAATGDHPAPAPKVDCDSIPCTHLSDDLIPLTMRGETWVLHVWASWCPYCRLDHPKLMGINTFNRGRLVSVLYKDSEESSANYLVANGNPYGGGRIRDSRAILESLNVHSVPATFVINPEGNIVRRYQGALGVGAQEALKRYLGE